MRLPNWFSMLLLGTKSRRVVGEGKEPEVEAKVPAHRWVEPVRVLRPVVVALHRSDH